MEKEKKLSLLAEKADFDKCSGKRLNTSIPGIWETYAGTKRVRLFKVLLSNICEKDCLYCANRKGKDCPRTTFKPEELSSIFYDLYKRGICDGLFLSSGIERNSTYAMDQMIKTVEILRKKLGFSGFVHLKILPGARSCQIEEALKLATRVSINIEAPNSKHLERIAPNKNMREEILKVIDEIFKLRDKFRTSFTTQLVVGASDETDKEILKSVFWLYKNRSLDRAYFSTYHFVEGAKIEKIVPEKRSYRLYQVDFLLRYYSFDLDDIVFDENDLLPLDLDPKELYAKKHGEVFPVDPNTADFFTLIKVPGIGPKGAKAILKIRREKTIDQYILKKIRVNLDRAKKYLYIR